jgi:hypothetical protein
MSAIPTFPDQQPPLRQHSKLGVASFVMALSIPVLLTVLVILALMLGTDTKAAPGWYSVWAFMICGLLAPLGHLVGVILGIVDALRKGSKRLFPVLGITLNLILGGIGAVILIYVIRLMFAALGAFR